MNPIVRVEQLCKQYRIGPKGPAYQTLRESIVSTVGGLFRNLGKKNGRRAEKTIWALRDVNLTVQPGEVLGIIGQNGAGKSTLLKVISRITEPTSGLVKLYGRVASLLEIGTGFHPELTGRENIFLNGAILGMKRSEIARKFDEIVAFSELEKFLDTPVKRYSSGMYMRLAFAVASHLEPEILVVDEVLAVGDAAFQKKCLGQMSQVAQAGRTVLFVSHNMTAVQRLCHRVAWLSEGSIVEAGPPAPVARKYLKTSFSTQAQRVWDDPAAAPGNEKVRLHQACVRPVDGSHHDSITVRTPFVLEFDYWNLAPGAQLNLSLGLYDEQGAAVFYTGPVGESRWQGKPLPEGLFRSLCYVPGDLLNDGTYSVQLSVVQDYTNAILRLDHVLVFDVLDAPEIRLGWYGKWPGAVRPVLEWQTQLLQTASGDASDQQAKESSR